MRSLVLICKQEHAEVLAATLKRQQLEDVRIIATTLGARLGVRRVGLPYDSIDSLAMELDRRTLRFDARYYARFWFELDGVRNHPLLDALRNYKGYPLYLMQWSHLIYWIMEALTSLAVAQALLEREKPAEVLLVYEPTTQPGYWYTPYENWDTQALAMLAGYTGVPVTWLTPKHPGASVGKFGCVRNHLRSLERLLLSLQRRDGKSQPNDTKQFVTLAIDRLHDGRRCLLAVSHGYYYLSQMLPYLRGLADRGIKIVLACHEEIPLSAVKELSSARIDLVELKPLVQQNHVDVTEWKQVATDAFAALEKNPDIRQFFTSRQGVCFWPLIRLKFQTLFLDDIPFTVAHLVAAEELIEHTKPNLVLSGLDIASVDAAYALAARKHGIPTLSFQHGTTLRDNVIDNPFASRILAVWGPMAQQLWMEAFRTTPDQHPVIGHAEFEDRYFIGQRLSRLDVQRTLRLDPQRPVCLYLGALGWVINDVNRYAEEAIFNTILDLPKAIPGLQLIMRLHAGEIVDQLRALAQERGVAAVIQPEATLQELFAVSDVVISQSTTAGLEAMVAGCPVIYLNIYSERDWLPYATSGAVVGVYEPEDLAPAVRHVLTDPSVREELARHARELINDYLNGLKGDAAQRMADLCVGLMGHEAQHTLANEQNAEPFADYIQRTIAFMRWAGPEWVPPVEVSLEQWPHM